ncbi:MgtC/SapB family protein [Paenibacillus sp. MER 180]|uniref:MgtC/SapB family protein n=2 Tax=unclassified Paenibacillus TaxID=185978 RepID=UPI000806721F|nr:MULTISPECIES: MgtC/SapB family protein [unclassified Paenibacillus]MCM3288723.1 MgtC/SapB family protein [Paenibacillus sp. MER 180]OBY79905.1 hypothetical protein BBG47_09150 [Paenibacillus sp. KS1]
MELGVHPEVWQIGMLELTLRVIIAVVLGGAIGLEREFGEHAAGFRTHILVCLGSALIMMLSSYGFSSFIYETNVRMDPARLAAQVISGIGFLGAGTILRTGMTVSGLTTAASLWVVAAIGLAVGAGFYYGALLTAFTAFFSLFMLNKLEKKFSRFSKSASVRQLALVIADGPRHIGKVLFILKEQNIAISDISIEPVERGLEARATVYPLVEDSSELDSHCCVLLQVTLKCRTWHIDKLLEKLLSEPCVRAVKHFGIDESTAEKSRWGLSDLFERKQEGQSVEEQSK